MKCKCIYVYICLCVCIFCKSLNASSTYFCLTPQNSVCLILEIFTLQPPLPHKHTMSILFSEFVQIKFEYMDSPSIKQVGMITFHSRHILQEKHCMCSAKISSFLWQLPSGSHQIALSSCHCCQWLMVQHPTFLEEPIVGSVAGV